MELKNVKVERVIFKNDTNGFAILGCLHEGRRIRVKGSLATFGADAVLTLEGKWETHPKYGDAFTVESVTEEMPADADAIRKYLGSGLIKGLGKKRAEDIVSKFGDKVFDILDNTPEMLLQVKGISDKKLKTIKECWEEQRGVRKVMMFLKSHEVSNAMAYRIYNHYGLMCIHILETNPYQLADDVNGIGFVSADKIASDFGVKPDSAERIHAGLNYVLGKKCEKDGCVYIERDELIGEAVKLLGVDTKMVEAQADGLAGSDDVVVRGTKFYPAMFFFAEKGVAHRLTDMAASLRHTDADIERVERTCGLQFDPVQKEAIAAALDNRVCVMTGGPGTGKTTTTLGIITALRAAGKKVLLAAPTGRAAKRLSETTGMEACTLHRLLEFSFESGFKRNEDNLLEGDALVLDEASMVDILLMNNLLKAVPADMQLVIVGDVDQLPSVGCGNCLHDIIESGHVKVIRLTKIFRQSEGSDIVLNAHRINRGQMPVLNTRTGSDFVFLSCGADTLHDELIRQYTALLRGGASPKDIQVLSPMRPGPCGVTALNARLQEAVNPPSPRKSELRCMGTIYREGDKVMQTKNNYEKDVFNGDIGFIRSIDEDEGTMRVEFNGCVTEFKETELTNMELAYASTIHKSQGSEFATVLIPMTRAHYVMHQRNLLYTAVTRAKKLCMMIGDPACVRWCVNNNVMELRNSTLIEQMDDYDY